MGDGPFGEHGRRQRQPKDPSEESAPFLSTFLSADFCDKYARPGKCSKLGKICNSSGFTWQSAGPCKHSNANMDFNGWDIDGDGYISPPEFQILMVMKVGSQVDTPTFKEMRKAVKEKNDMFKNRDANQDNRLSCAEFFVGMVSQEE